MGNPNTSINEPLSSKLPPETISELLELFGEDEKLGVFLNHCDQFGLKVVGFEDGFFTEEILLYSKDGRTIQVSPLWLNLDEVGDFGKFMDSMEQFDIIMNTWNSVPEFYKQFTRRLHLDYSFSTAASYNGMGTVKIPSFFSSNISGPDYVGGVLLHEIGHSFDLGISVIQSFGDLQTQMNGGLSASEGFKDILNHENSSTYSLIYHPSGKYKPSDWSNEDFRKESQKYPTESFAEMMKITGKAKLFGPQNAYIEYPVISNGKIIKYRKVNYTEWKKINPNLAKVGNLVWNSGSKEKAEKIMKNLKYDSSLKSKPLTIRNFKERSEEWSGEY